MAKESHPDYSEYVDGINQPLTPDSWAIDLSEAHYGRLWRIQQEGEVLYRLTEGRTPIVLQRGRTPWLCKIHLPEFITGSALQSWRKLFLQEDAWMWIEHPRGNTQTVKLTAALNGHTIWTYETSLAMLNEGPMPFLANVERWLDYCLKSYKNDYMGHIFGFHS
ncbi:MAG TPA: hypothetical protein VF630_12470 [Hymenobacter sp.]